MGRRSGVRRSWWRSEGWEVRSREWWVRCHRSGVIGHESRVKSQESGDRCRGQWSCIENEFQYSATGTRTRVARVRAEYPNQLDYSGCWLCHWNTCACLFVLTFWSMTPDPWLPTPPFPLLTSHPSLLTQDLLTPDLGPMTLDFSPRTHNSWPMTHDSWPMISQSLPLTPHFRPLDLVT